MSAVERNVYIILVSYYPKYKQNAINSIKTFAKTSGLNCKLCVVYNNKSAQLENVTNSSIIDAEVVGTNIGWEFSAWDEGVAWVNEHWQTQANDIFLFANDTFCHHRSFSKINANFICGSIKNIQSGQLVGDKIHLDKMGKVDGLEADTFLSSYLFLVQKSDLNLLLPFDKVRVDQDLLQSISLDNRQVVMRGSNSYIENRLTGFIFPSESGKGWYNANSNNPELIRLKIIAAINEFLLSFTVIDKGGSLAEFYPKPWMKKVIKIQRKILKRLPKSKR